MTVSKHFLALIFSVLLLPLFISVGFHLASNKKLWNDEIYTQIYSIDAAEYSKIFKGNLSEGNNTPLFYALQKWTVTRFHFHAPAKWEGKPKAADPLAQIVLRINSILAVSLGMSALFYFFASRFNIPIGLLSLAVMLSFAPVWNYWAEGRPYGLWIALAMGQLLLGMDFILNKTKEFNHWLTLTVLNVLLSLTVVFSLIQTIILTAALWRKGADKLKVVISFVPALAAGMLYYLKAPKLTFYFDKPPIDLILSIILPEAWIFFFILFFLWVLLKDKKLFQENFFGTQLSSIFLMSVVAAACLLGLLVYKNKPSISSFALTNRYFVFLVPIFTVALTVVLTDIARLSKALTRLWPSFYALTGLFLAAFYIQQEDIWLKILDIYLYF